MLERLALGLISRAAPALLPGQNLHHRALAAAEAGHGEQAEALFEAAAAAYRREWAVEPMARLRVHQRMVRARSAGDAEREAAAMLEIVRALNKLDQLESLEAPYPLRDAREVLSEWLAGGRATVVAKVEAAGTRPELAGAAVVAWFEGARPAA